MLTHLRAAFHKSILLSMVFSLLGVTVALAASGDLDPTFNGNGRVTTDFGGRNDFLNALAIQPDGKIVAAGTSQEAGNEDNNFILARYRPNGSLDPTFSGDGRVRTDFGNRSSAISVAVLSNGKTIAAGYTCDIWCDVALARYKTNGQLDPTFSGDGKVVTKFGGAQTATSDMAIQPDGKIVVAGSYYLFDGSGPQYGMAVYRYLPNGRLDTTFSGDGRFVLTSEDFVYASGMAIQPGDGKIVVTGRMWRNDELFDFTIIRLLPNGTLDDTFSGNGIQSTDFGFTDDSASDVAIQPDGKIVVVGHTHVEDTFLGFAVARYNPNGSLDNTFGRRLPNGKRTGTLMFMIGGFSYGAGAVIVQPDGKIVIAGESGSTEGDFALVRLKPNGAFDATFNGNGIRTIDFGGEIAGVGTSLVRQKADGKYVVGGIIRGYDSDFVLARVLP